MIKKFLKQTFAYSLVFGVLALVTPVTVAAQSVKSLNLYGIDTAGVRDLNLYGIDTGRVAATATGLTELQVAAIVLSVIVGVTLIANGKYLKRVLSK